MDDDLVDRDAILSRREALVAMALGGIALACGEPEPVPCLQPRVVDTPVTTPPCLAPCTSHEWRSLGTILVADGAARLDEPGLASLRAALEQRPENASERLCVHARALPVTGEPPDAARDAARVALVAGALEQLGAPSDAQPPGALPEPTPAEAPAVEVLGYFELRFC